MEKICIIYSTFGDLESADHMRKLLIDKKAIACGNIVDANSCYIWQGQVTSDEEKLLICKTTSAKVNKAINLIEQFHPYEVPCILHWEVSVNKSYLAWVKEVVGE